MTLLLNCDLGESFGNYSIGADDAILPLIDQANVACGFHAGDARVMDLTCARAAELGIQIGAHVGYRDLAGFGRRYIDYVPAELTAEVIYQIGALQAMAKSHGAAVTYVKPHGALYNTIAQGGPQAEAVIEGILRADENLTLMGLAGSPILELAQSRGLSTFAEAFADRAYTKDGTLSSRRLEGSVLNEEDGVKQALAIAAGTPFRTIEGEEIVLQADSLCVHGDSPEALAMVRSIRAAL
ncbi:hypothetical protein C1Y63_06785 [Corynebacterium sp. 13CS0277]|uniref:LamB/YcsF family protein n=1 Tax=Corynebacterium sp. 13CS0277 TaxID=2071994 RepID=UPI000D02A18A|nr:5-oxoprolinase subunit PxpA [Corynebacterium sp. 13CS0277]PRQ11253.1 hypothetical protein C1Y63_06785 [Corynebacterium sp. 13CS0277]